jgi:hypothetical protein
MRFASVPIEEDFKPAYSVTRNLVVEWAGFDQEFLNGELPESITRGHQ